MVWVASVGIGLGGFFSMSLIVTLDHLPDARLAGALAAFVQGVGSDLAATRGRSAGCATRAAASRSRGGRMPAWSRRWPR
jgi:cyanate permease